MSTVLNSSSAGSIPAVVTFSVVDDVDDARFIDNFSAIVWTSKIGGVTDKQASSNEDDRPLSVDLSMSAADFDEGRRCWMLLAAATATCSRGLPSPSTGRE